MKKERIRKWISSLLLIALVFSLGSHSSFEVHASEPVVQSGSEDAAETVNNAAENREGAAAAAAGAVENAADTASETAAGAPETGAGTSMEPAADSVKTAAEPAAGLAGTGAGTAAETAAGGAEDGTAKEAGSSQEEIPAAEEEGRYFGEEDAILDPAAGTALAPSTVSVNITLGEGHQTLESIPVLIWKYPDKYTKYEILEIVNNYVREALWHNPEYPDHPNAMKHNGELFLGVGLKPLSGYKDYGAYAAEKKALQTSGEMLTSNITVYLLWAKPVTSASAAVAAPFCGTKTNTPIEGGMEDWDNQTNKPDVTVASGAHYDLFQQGSVRKGSYWTKTSDPNSPDYYIPFIGTFKGDQSYNCELVLETKWGWYFDAESTVTAKVNGKAAAVTRVEYDDDFGTPDIPSFRSLVYLRTSVKAEHDWDEGTVTTPPTATSTGIRTYHCKANSSHTKKETIPKLTSIKITVDMGGHSFLVTPTHGGSYMTFPVNQYTKYGAIHETIYTSIRNQLKNSSSYPDHPNALKDNGELLLGIGLKPLTGYKNYGEYAAEKKAMQDSGEMLTADMTVYLLWAKPVSSVSASVQSPLCGTSTNTPYADMLDSQTNKPVVTVASGEHYDLYGLGTGSPAAYWLKSTDPDDPEYFDPYIGTFTGGKSYICELVMDAKWGWYFDAESTITAKVNGKNADVHQVYYGDNTLLLADPSFESHVYLLTTVTAEHNWDAGTVTKPATSKETGIRTYHCKANSAHTKTETIPKLTTIKKLWRFYSKRNLDHFYTMYDGEKDSLIASGSHYGFEGQGWLIDTQKRDDNVTVYRFYNEKDKDHFYTISVAERDQLIAKYNAGRSYYRYENVGWYTPKKSDTPLYRFYNAVSKDHFYTTNKAEKEQIEANYNAGRSNYKYEGIAWYCAE